MEQNVPENGIMRTGRLIKKTCKNRKCDGYFYFWEYEQVKFCPYCGQKLVIRDKAHAEAVGATND